MILIFSEGMRTISTDSCVTAGTLAFILTNNSSLSASNIIPRNSVNFNMCTQFVNLIQNPENNWSGDSLNTPKVHKRIHTSTYMVLLQLLLKLDWKSILLFLSRCQSSVKDVMALVHYFYQYNEEAMGVFVLLFQKWLWLQTFGLNIS